MIFQTLFSALIYYICYGATSGSGKIENVCPFSECSAKYTSKNITDETSVTT